MTRAAAHGVRRAVDLARAIVVFALLAIAAGCRSMAPADAPDHVDIVTLNLWHDRGDWPRREAMIEDELRRLDPDVIVLQEVLQDAGLPNQAHTLAQRLGYRWHFVSVDAPERTRRYGNAILTREAIVQRGERALQPKDDYRIAGWARTTVRGRALNVYVVHLNFSDRSGATRAKQIEDLMAFIATTRGDAPAIVGGDFNTVASSPELAPLHARFVDAYAVVHADADADADVAAQHLTLNPAFNPPARIDRIYGQAGAFGSPQAKRILDRQGADGTWASDHFGVWVRLPWLAAGSD